MGEPTINEAAVEAAQRAVADHVDAFGWENTTPRAIARAALAPSDEEPGT